jgi:uncharacterized protein YdaU (DUF1376 family)
MKGEFYKMEYEAWDEAMEHLSLEQEACALRLIHQMYRRRGPVANHLPALARLWRSHQNKARTILKVLLESGIIQLTPEGHLTNTRVRRELDARETQRTHKVDAGKTGGRRSADARQTAAKKANEINDGGQAPASTPPKQIQPEERREEERRVEDRREEAPVDEPLPWEVAQTTPDTSAQTEVKGYAFEAGIIRLNQADWDRWLKAYPNINLAGELTSMADWASRLKAEGKNWFTVIPNQLIKLERTARKEREESRMAAEARAKQGARYAPGQMAI